MKLLKKIGHGFGKIAAFVAPAAKIALEVTAVVAPFVPGAGIIVSAAAAAGAYGIDQHEKHVDRKENRKKEQEALETANRQRDIASQQILAAEQAAQSSVDADDIHTREAIAEHFAATRATIEQHHSQNVYNLQQKHTIQREFITNRAGPKVAVGVAANTGTTGYSVGLTYGAGGTPDKMGYGSIEIYNRDFPRPVTVPATTEQEPGTYEPDDTVIIPEPAGEFKPAVILDHETSLTKENTIAAKTDVIVSPNTSENTGVINWCKMAWRALSGEESEAVMQWQAANRSKAPGTAEFIDSIGESPIQRHVNAFSGSFTDQVIVKPAKFLGEEAARIKLREQTKTAAMSELIWDSTKGVGRFVGSEVQHVLAFEPTETGIFFENVGNFVAADYTRLRNGQETVIGTVITNDFQALANMSSEEIAGYLGHEAGNAVLFLFAGGAAQAGTRAVSKVVDYTYTAGKEFAAANTLRSPLVLQFEWGRLNSGFPVDVVKGRKPWAKKHVDPALNTQPIFTEKLTKGQIVDYLQNVDKIPMHQLASDLERLGFELLAERPEKGIYKFSHVKNHLRGTDQAKANLESSKFIVELHNDAKSGPHLHIKDSHGNVYDKHLNNLTSKLSEENPGLSIKVIEKRVERLPEAHITIKEFVELNMRPINE